MSECMPGHQKNDSLTSQTSLSGTSTDVCDFLRTSRLGFYDYLPIGYITLDKEGRIIEINQVATGILSISGNQLKGENFFDLLDPGDMKIMGRNGCRFQDMGIDSQINLRIRGGSSRTWIKACVMETGDSKNKTLSLVFTDITTQKQTEKELGWQLRVGMELDTITDALSQPDPDYNRIFRIILTAAADLTQSANGFIASLSRNTHSSVEMVFDQVYPEKCRMDSQYMQMALDDHGGYTGLLGKALNSGKPFFTSASHARSSFLRLPKGHIPINGFLALPLTFNHQTLGLMVLANPENSYSQEMVKMATRMAKLYTIAVKLKLSG